MSQRQRLIIGITGASGAAYGLSLLQHLRKQSLWESHLIVSNSAYITIKQELNLERQTLEDLADEVHSIRNIGASIASGSFKTAGMIVAPCSMKTLASIAHGMADNLISRSADVILKERRKLVLMARETPFNLIHLRNMCSVTEAGGIIFPPLPMLYAQPKTIQEMIDQTTSRVLTLFGIEVDQSVVWKGLKPSEHSLDSQ